MIIKKISILNDFKCCASSCTASCCRGWKIPVDSDMYMKYLEQKGVLGFALKCSIEKKDDIVAFRSGLSGCPFWGIDKLCYLQKKYGTDYMPLVCVQFPRQLYNLAFFCEEMLYLACPEAARLFLMHINDENPIEFIISDGKPSYSPNTTNDDKGFLDYLVISRAELINLLENGCPYNSKAITDYAISAQNNVLSQHLPPSPNEFAEINSIEISRPFTCEDMNKLMANGFYHHSLKTISPFLYRLCKKYYSELGIPYKLNPSKSNEKLNRMILELYDKFDNIPNLLKRYYEYFLLSDFLDIFEDYSFSKHISFGVDKTNMLLVFLAVYSKGQQSVSIDEIAKIIAVFERRAPQIY